MARINFFLGIIVLFLGLVAVVTVASSMMTETAASPLVRHTPQFRKIANIEPAAGTAVLQEKVDNSWRLECPGQETIQSKCREFGHLVWQDQAEKLLITLTMLRGEEASIPRMRVIAPLGTFLPAGLTMRLTDEQELSVPFQFCVPGGCFVNLDLAADIIEKMKIAETLEIYFKNADGTQSQMSVPLRGLVDGLDNLNVSEVASNKIE